MMVKRIKYLWLSIIPLIVCILFIIALNKYPMGWNDIIVQDGVVVQINPGSPYADAGVRKSDKLISFNGNSNITFLEEGNPYDTWLPYEAGTTYYISLQRDSKILKFSILFPSLWSTDKVFFIFYNTLIILVIFTGIFILLKRPGDKSARIFYFFSLILAISSHTRHFLIASSYVPSLFFLASYPFISILYFHFLTVFPHNNKLNKSLKRALILMYACGIFFSLFNSVTYLNFILFKIPQYNIFDPIARVAANVWMGISVLLVVVYSFIRYRYLEDSFSKNQYRWVITGFLFGVFLPMIFGLMQPLTHINEKFIWANSPNILLYVNGIVTPIMLICFLFAIMKYKVWDIELIIKKGLLYSGVTFSIIAIYFLSMYLSEFLLSESSRTAKFIAIIAATIAFIPVREGIQKKVNKIFYREKFDPAMAIYNYENKLMGIYETEKLYPAILEEINNIFHFEGCNIYKLKHDNIFEEVCSAKRDPELKTGSADKSSEILPDSEFVRKLGIIKPFAIGELKNKNCFPDIEIITPLTNGENIFGFLACGRKKSHEILTLQDIKLLQMLAQRTLSIINTSDLYKKELERQLLVERERDRISRDMHDEIGSSLTRISIISQLIKKNSSEHEEVNKLIEEISQSSLETISNISEIIWAINPNYDSLDDLVSYLNNYASKFFESTAINYKFYGPDILPELKLTSEQRRNVFLTVKEALNNALKYSESSLIILEIKLEEDSVTIRIKDNGKGFCTGEKSSGNGLRNMRKRIEAAGGSFSISSSEGSGTEIQLMLNE